MNGPIMAGPVQDPIDPTKLGSYLKKVLPWIQTPLAVKQVFSSTRPYRIRNLRIFPLIRCRISSMDSRILHTS